MEVQEFYELYRKADNVVIDSRKVQQGDIFFAFSGETFNAATLAAQVVENGAIAAIVEQKDYADLEKNIIYKPSTLDFLQELALYHRSQLKIPIIGLTGSNGKTTTKELISTVLSKKFNVQYTFGNLNNHIGVPLTILSIKPEHEMAVIEMGANHQKEITALCEIAQPDYGYITNFGKAHLEGFGGVEGVIKGKSELYDYLKKHGKTLVINENDPIQVEKSSGYSPKISFGGPQSDYQFNLINQDNFVGIEYNGIRAQSRLTGDYNYTNLCAATALGLHFGIPFEEIKSAIEAYSPTNMRSQVVKLNGRTLVLDTYNANPSSMSASLKNFNTFKGSKAVILGDMLELGDESAAEHESILSQVQAFNFEEIITVGKHFMDANRNLAFQDTAALIEHLKNHPISAENILLKGSRGIALEKVIDYL